MIGKEQVDALWELRSVISASPHRKLQLLQQVLEELLCRESSRSLYGASPQGHGHGSRCMRTSLP